MKTNLKSFNSKIRHFLGLVPLGVHQFSKFSEGRLKKQGAYQNLSKLMSHNFQEANIKNFSLNIVIPLCFLGIVEKSHRATVQK